MNREQEARLTEYEAAGKVSKDVTLWVRNKDTNKVSPILGSMLSSFINEKTYEIFDENPEPQAVEKAEPVKKKK